MTAQERLDLEEQHRQFMMLFTRVFDALAPRMIDMLRLEVENEMPRMIEQAVEERLHELIVMGSVRKVADEARARVMSTLRRAVEEDDDDDRR